MTESNITNRFQPFYQKYLLDIEQFIDKLVVT